MMHQFFYPNQLLAWFAKVQTKQSLAHRTYLLVSVSSEWLVSIARQIAAIFCCPHLNPLPCGECSVCQKIQLHAHPDITVLEPTEAKIISMEQIRDMIADTQNRPWESEYKIFIIRDVETLKREGLNALLKTLEEPPSHCIFFLTTQNADAILPTILSRSQVFRLVPDTQDAVHQLMQDFQVSPEEAQCVFQWSNQNIEAAKDALQNTWKYRKMMLQACTNQDPIQTSEQFCKLSSEQKFTTATTLDLLSYMASFWHDVLLCQYTEGNVDWIVNRDFLPQIQALAQKCSTHKVQELVEFFSGLS